MAMPSRILRMHQAFRRYFSANHHIYLPKEASWSLAELNLHNSSPYGNDSSVLSLNTIKDLAELAHLEVEPERLLINRKDVESILRCTKIIQNNVGLEDYVDRVYSAKSTDENGAPLREDTIRDGGYPDELLCNASTRSGYYFVVPKVVEE